MKKRLDSLDGLRGFAALSVVFAHLSLGGVSFFLIPFFSLIYSFFANGVNAVQIFFVLSGFFMASLYPDVSQGTSFIRKRFSRIFPVLGTVVLFITLSEGPFARYFYHPVFLLLLTAAFMYFFLTWIKRVPFISRLVFYIFLAVQIIVGAINFTDTLFHLSIVRKEPFATLLAVLSNMTLTVPFSNHIKLLRGLFWSLIPEIIFYIAYPFIVVPLVRLGKRYGVFVGIILCVGVLTIIFNIDHAMIGFAGFQAINFARSSGFIIGVVIGSLYQQQNAIWRQMETYSKKTVLNVIAVILLILVQTNFLRFIHEQAILSSPLFFLLISILIGYVLISVITPETALNKIFRWKVFTFLGIISYSLYLIHQDAIGWSISILQPFVHYFSHDMLILVSSVVAMGCSIIAALILYRFVEVVQAQAKYSHRDNTIQVNGNMFFTLILFIGVISFLYAGFLSPSFLVERSFINSHIISKPIRLLTSPAEIQFYSPHNGLSIVSLDMRYEKSANTTEYHNPHPATLVFSLYDAPSKQLLFTSTSSAYLVEGEPHFAFGFPPMSKSKGKAYIVRISLHGGSIDDQVVVDTSSTSMTTSYLLQGSRISHVLVLFANRIMYVVKTLPAMGAIVFVVIILLIDTTILKANGKRKNIPL